MKNRRCIKYSNKYGLSLVATALLVGAGQYRLKAQDAVVLASQAHSLSVPGEVLVGIRPEVDGMKSMSSVQSLGFDAGHSSALHAHRIRLRAGVSIEAAVAALRKRSDVLYAEPNYIISATSIPNDPSFSRQYGLPKINAPQAWDKWSPKASVVLAIIDSGVDGAHPDLAGKMYRDSVGIIGYNAFTGKRDNADDDFGHGTHCAGIAAAQGNNGIGVSGVAGLGDVIKLMPVKVLDASGSGADSSVTDGIVWAVDHGAKVISMSLGSPSESFTMDSAVQYAWSKGCIVVAAAGNNGSSNQFYPAAIRNVISVAATDGNDTLTSWSNYGSWVSVAAPGSGIYSTLPTLCSNNRFGGTSYGTLSGTSMATPFVAGEAAMLVAQNPQLTNAQISALITRSVDKYNPVYGRTIAANAGRINVYTAVTGVSAVPVNTFVYRVNCGSGATATFAPDSFYTGGATNYTSAPIDVTGVANAAPASVYQTARQGSAFSYTLPGLTPGTTYTVRMHFAETYYNSTQMRVFDVLLNGATVQSNLDVMDVTREQYKALVYDYNSAADKNGCITVRLRASKGIASVCGIELIAASLITQTPSVPVGLTAAAGDHTALLKWTVAGNATSYTVKRSTVSGGPYTTIAGTATVVANTMSASFAATSVVAALTIPSFTDTNLTNGDTYYYVVTSVNDSGESTLSSEVSASPVTPPPAIYHINVGGGAEAGFIADCFYTGGATAGFHSGAIDLSTAANAAPMSVYQTQRFGSRLLYTLPNLVPGKAYTVRLHLAESWFTSSGQRIFNVLLNGVTVQTNLDIVALAGGANKALTRDYTATADVNGRVVLMLQATRGNASLCGIEVLPQG